MVDVIVLCAGASSRFPQARPKWLLTHPNGRPLFARAADGLLGEFSTYVVVLREHLVNHGITQSQIREFLPGARVIIFDSKTNSQAESAKQAVDMVGPKGAFFFKDCDSHFVHEVQAENCVVTGRVDGPAPYDFQAKCFIQSDNVGTIHNIVEKKIISDEFSVGGYGFASADVFNTAFSRVARNSGEMFLSHVVLAGMLNREVFFARKAAGYEDYGTPEAFQHEKSRYGTIFVDLDGTLIQNRSALGVKTWGTGDVLARNAGEIRRLHATGRYQIIITTARPESKRAATVEELQKHGIPHHTILMGLLNASRLIINDHLPNTSAMARAVSIERDADSLSGWLADLK